MCIPKPKVNTTTVKADPTPQAAPQPAPVAENVGPSEDDTSLGIKAARGASKLSKKRSTALGTSVPQVGASGASGLGIGGVAK